MKKYIDGFVYDLTEDEKREFEEIARTERVRSKSYSEGINVLNQYLIDSTLEQFVKNEDKTLAIACMALFEPWTPGLYSVGDVRTNPETGYPRECILAHDSTTNADWGIMTTTLWKPYHSRKAEYALPWETPTGAHDMYKAGEYMIWTDYEIYKCLSDTNFSPSDYASAWEKVTA